MVNLINKIKNYLNKNKMVVPLGIVFKIVVSPSLTLNHQKGLRHIIIKNSSLNQYFKNINVTFYDKYKGKQMLIKVFCPEPIIAVEKNKEEDFYNHIKTQITKFIIETIQRESKYKAKLEEFLLTQKIT